ncbi:PQQ-dependent sugar dehydrogenase [Conexibacter sp. JD483]|uniref:PQQ-dependent sugar dehydrogenase n=1 Tax=unclassified Conexibacter TaxID=2627773 RepID=UPI00271D3453|nr:MULTISPECIES: PQQ-dependent sugar dehydrogenase [unclassified Conexibacter]MDO8189175.1 PQQ-dependent sugar dehydrogenase [Conexibacter sp. CPCC 205706]MDO8201939.1 PQQ-dependent sugar dehydrogenase [Conexibacter sp. CPCC 205762]MDR9372381.1 PQQ-dependent sugar dehydrogenase [Conexibacter sp. JD483]
MYRRARLTSICTAFATVVALTACGDTPARTSTSTTPAADSGGGGGSATAPTSQTAAARGVKLTRVGRLDNPVWITQAPGDRSRLFVVEQPGRIRVIRNGRTLSQPFADLTSRLVSGGEQGLLSIAFAPDYQQSGLLYAFFTDRAGDERVVELRRGSSPDRSDGSVRTVLTQADEESNHNGGLLLFGPDDRLYIGIGDGGGAFDRHGAHGNGQNLNTLLGKILRIDPRKSGGKPYTVPADNPFVGRSGAKPEIWSYGLRNPWRFSFDRQTGDLSIADVGQNEIEEIDFVPKKGARGAGPGAGLNFGWRAWEGTNRIDREINPRPVVFPVLEYSHKSGGCSVTGGYVVRDPRLTSLRGQYVYGDFCKGELMAAKLKRPRASGNRALGIRVPGITSFGEDLSGRVYVISQSGPVYRLDPR